MKTNPIYLFHYTSEVRLIQILNSKKLKVSNAFIEKKEKPALWLSTDPVWDESALKFRNFKNKQHQHEEIGLARVVIPFLDHFITYGKWKHISHISKELTYSMEINFPNYSRDLWFASFKDVSMNDFICCEYWDGKAWKIYDETIVRDFTKYESLFKPIN